MAMQGMRLLLRGRKYGCQACSPLFKYKNYSTEPRTEAKYFKGTNLTSITTNKICARKKKIASFKIEPEKQEYLTTVFSTAEEYDLDSISKQIRSDGLYNISQLIDPYSTNALYVTANYKLNGEPRGIFFFKEGSVVFWNTQDFEIQNIMEFLKPYECGPYDEETVQEERETIVYSRENLLQCRLNNGKIYLKLDDSNCILEKYAFSHALSISAKLGIWEASLDDYVQGMEFIYEELRNGAIKRLGRHDVLKRSGEIYGLRHLINLSSDLLDTPDFYWEQEDLEKNYHQTCTYLSITKRTKVMNEKINHLCELMDLVSTHLNDKHHVRLEIMIIALILVEVIFEVLHFIL